MRIAVECFADLTLLKFMRDQCGLPQLIDRHSYSQGEVVKAVFETGRADAGIVDEDPGKSHHRLRDNAHVIGRGIDVEVLELNHRRLFLVKPDLETCFIRGMKRVKESCSFNNASQMHRMLSTSSSRREHERFARDLGLLRDASARLSVPSLVSELEDGLRALFPNS